MHTRGDFRDEIHLGKGRNSMNKKFARRCWMGHISQIAVLPAFKHAGSAFGAYLKKSK
jgi:hypothetical protein